MLIKCYISDKKVSKAFPTHWQALAPAYPMKYYYFLHISINNNEFYTLYKVEECCLARNITAFNIKIPGFVDIHYKLVLINFKGKRAMIEQNNDKMLTICWHY